MKSISPKRAQIRGQGMKGTSKGSKDMPYKAIRFISDYHVDDIKEATKAMDTAGAFDMPGIGSWRIEEIGEKISYLFFPGESTKLGLAKQEYLWMQIGKKTKEKWEEKLPGHKFEYALDADTKEPNGMFSRFRKHKRQAMMLKDFFANKEKVNDALEKAKLMVEEVKKPENADN